jgi:DNA invertase Pin-like site-specific DNA recombinase
MSMNTCINSGNGGACQDSNAPQGDERYFDADGKLLKAHYPDVYDQIAEAAKRHGKDLSWLNRDEPLEKRRAAARANGWEIGSSYCRCSTDMQDSYQGQMTACIDKAIASGIVIFPELAAGDEAVSGKKNGRAGLNLVKEWVRAAMFSVFVAFSITRLFRRLHTGLRFVREDIIEHGVRVLAVAEHIDSADKQFSMLLNVNMMVAEMQASALPEFVRMGQKAHVENGFLVGACTAGYKPVPVPEAGLTKKGKVKTRAEVVPEVAEMIRRSYERIAGGATISEACRLYNQDAAGLPEDIRRYAERSPHGAVRVVPREDLVARDLHGLADGVGVVHDPHERPREVGVVHECPE